MIKSFIAFACVLSVLFSEYALASEDIESESIDYRIIISKLEKQYNNDNNPIEWDFLGVVGTRTDKLWLKYEGESSGQVTSDAELRLFYSRSLTAKWDVQLGGRHDRQPNPTRNWVQIGLIGIVPYEVATDIVMFVGEEGRVNARLAAVYVYKMSKRWRFTPDIEINLYNKDDPELHSGRGLSDAEIGLRLRYKLTDNFRPYLSAVWQGTFGRTKEFALANGDDANDYRAGIGFSFWF